MGGKINIDAVITNMRNTRCHMVQTEQQYLCVHHTVVAGIDWLLHNFKANKPAQDTSPQDSYGDEEARKKSRDDIFRVGIFLDFVRRPGTTRAEGPHGWALNTCGEPNEIGLTATHG